MRRKNKLVLYAFISIAAVSCVLYLAVFRKMLPERPQYNVVYIVVDALRSDHLSSSGYQPEYYPNITRNMDTLASEGIRFSNAFCHVNWTLPSDITQLTSLYPPVHGVTEPGELNDGFVTLAEVFERSGYETAAYVSGGYVKKKFGLSQGFDVYVDKLDIAENILGQAGDWIKKNKDNKFFAFIHLYDPHVPYDPPEKYMISEEYTWEQKWVGSAQFWQKHDRKKLAEIMTAGDFREKVIELYDAAIKYTDDELGIFLEKLKGLGLEDNTLIVLTADHGEAFDDHGAWSHGWLYDESIHVPLIMKLPGSFQKFNQRIIDTQVGHIDLMPTIMDLTNLSFKDYPIQGQSLVRLIKGKRQKDRMIFFHRERRRHLMGIRTTQHKYIVDLLQPELNELYDLEKDPGEQQNLLSDPTPEVLAIKAELEKQLNQMLKANADLTTKLKTGKTRLFDPEDLKKSEELEEDLKSLGYIK